MVTEIVKTSLMSGKELKKLRKKLNYNLRDFGSKVGIDFSTIGKYEKGKRYISARTEAQIKQALGLSFESKHDYELHVHLDFLRLTFFDASLEIIMNRVVGIEKTYFTFTENKLHGFDGVWQSGMIRIYSSHERPEQGIMLELTGQGLTEMESWLQELDKNFTLNEWLVMITDPDYYLKEGLFSRYNCSRLDIAIDEMYKATGNYDLHDLKWKKDHHSEKLIETQLRSSHDIESYWNDKPLGLTLYFGSPNGNFLLRMYEKAKERAKKENRELEDVLHDYGVVNRYEMQIRENYARSAFDELAQKGRLDQFAIDLLLSKITVYDEIKTESGEVAYQYSKAFYDVFGHYEKVKINGKKVETSIERSMKWIISQVAGTLALFREVYGRQWLFDWLNQIMDEVEFNKKQEGMILFEKARLTENDNGMYLWYKKKIAEKKYEPQNITAEEISPDSKLWGLRLKDVPSKFNIYINEIGEYQVSEPKGMTLEHINDLGEKKSVDFFNSSLFIVFEVKK
ncbi:replication initiation factor domain-containing protein [Lactococcus lactis]|uniref:replication initiation factor domain-containing protein n=1 Tax=Lactococcus lactis TaxID=1358 RepID=UPI003D2A2FC5